MEDIRIEDKKYLVECPNCGNIFLPWRCLSITTAETNWKTHCVCPSCKKMFERDSSYVKKH